MHWMFLPLALAATAAAAASVPASPASSADAARSVNALGLELHRQMDPTGNVCLSPYSIQAALAMTYLGASGKTREEMARVLHFPSDPGAAAASFSALNQELERMTELSRKSAEQMNRGGLASEPLQLDVANRLFGQNDYAFRPAFLEAVEAGFGAPLEAMDFRADPSAATGHINRWVAERTRERIRDLIPGGALTRDTRLVLANALYLKAQWLLPFQKEGTSLQPFHASGAEATVDVPTLRKDGERLRYLKGDGFQAVSLPYASADLHFLLIVPDAVDGVAAVERSLTPDALASMARAKTVEVNLHLPKFRIQPPTIPLAEILQRMGLQSAFDKPRGSADFDAMAPRKPDDYLFISEVFHKTFIAIDELGTEAAAATAVAMARATAWNPDPPKPVEVRADRPFLFAIQHGASGACLFLGRVSDPR